MLVVFVSIGVLVASLLCVSKVNKKFDAPTVEELESYQESVFLHIDEQVNLYKKDMALYNKENLDGRIEMLSRLLKEIDKKEAILIDIEERIDRKLIQCKNYDNLLK